MQNDVLAVTFGAGKDPGGHSRLPTTSSIPRRPFTARMEAVADLILSLISYLVSLSILLSMDIYHLVVEGGN